MVFDTDNSLQNAEQPLYQAQKSVQKLLKALLEIYAEYFDSSTFDEEKQAVRDRKVLANFRTEMLGLRSQELSMLGDCNITAIIFNENVAQKSNIEDEKLCFWLNIFNYKLLQKVMEVLAS